VKVFLVRHAHAGDREDWRGDDRERPLTDKGKRQAAGLVGLLAGETISRVLSSPYIRCVQTVEPLAAARGLAVEEEDLLAEGAPWRDALRLIEVTETPTVMCSQGDVIGYVVEELVRRGVISEQEVRWSKASTWVLKVGGGAVGSARYLPPPG
jgi:8-oxo-dGTP diphosphatase